MWTKPRRKDRQIKPVDSVDMLISWANVDSFTIWMLKEYWFLGAQMDDADFLHISYHIIRVDIYSTSECIAAGNAGFSRALRI